MGGRKKKKKGGGGGGGEEKKRKKGKGLGQPCTCTQDSPVARLEAAPQWRPQSHLRIDLGTVHRDQRRPPSSVQWAARTSKGAGWAGQGGLANSGRQERVVCQHSSGLPAFALGLSSETFQ